MAGLRTGRWVLLFAWLYAASAAAQIVNVQALFGEKAPPGPSAAVDLGADWRTGSTSLFTVRGALLGQWRTETHTWLAAIRGEYAFASGERIVSKVLEHVRYRYRFTERLSGEAFAQHEYDEFRRLQFRALLGAGPRLTLLSHEDATLVFGVAVMLEHERLRKDGEVDAGNRATDPRLSSYLLARVKLMENIHLVETFYAQPRLTGPSDIRLLNDTIFEVTPNERVTVGIGFNLTFDSAPPATVSRLDTQLRTSVGLRL
jgi:putative salt-induced outer membrane protein YdiY